MFLESRFSGFALQAIEQQMLFVIMDEKKSEDDSWPRLATFTMWTGPHMSLIFGKTLYPGS